MKLVIQRVESAKVEVEGKLVSIIGKGFLILMGVSATDDGSEIEWLAQKTVGLRIFQDAENKMNLSIKILMVRFFWFRNSHFMQIVKKEKDRVSSMQPNLKRQKDFITCLLKN